MLTPQEQHIELLLQSNLKALHDAFFDLLAALVLVVIAVVSVAHALLRIVFACLGLLLWAGTLLTIWLYSVRAWAIARSSSSLHTLR